MIISNNGTPGVFQIDAIAESGNRTQAAMTGTDNSRLQKCGRRSVDGPAATPSATNDSPNTSSHANAMLL
jgi:hypothetical protein